jgi:hypothetical protein
MVFWGHNLGIKFQILALKFLLLTLKFLILALKFLKNCPKICPNFLSEGAGQPESDQDPCCSLTNPITSRETDSEHHRS